MGIIVTLPVTNEEKNKEHRKFCAGTFYGAGQSCPTVIDGEACTGGLLYNCFNKTKDGTITESWTCLTCRKTFIRTFKWEELEESK